MRDEQFNGKSGMPPMRNMNPRAIEPGLNAPVEASQGMAYGITMQDFLQVMRRRFWIVALSAILLTGAAVGYSLYQTPVYEASNKLIIGYKPGSDVPTSLASDVDGLQQLTRTMTHTIQTRPIAEAVIRELNLRESPEVFLGKNLTAEQVSDTQLIEVSYLHTNPEQARRIVNAVGDEFSEQVSDVSPTTSAITATVWERAVTPDAPVSPDPQRNGLLALMIGGMLGVGLAFLLEYRDDRLRSPEEVEQISGIPVFCVVPRFEKPKGKRGD